MNVEFFVAGVPRTKGSSHSFYNPKTKSTVFQHDNEHLKAWQSMMSFTARQRGCKPTLGPVSVTICYILPRPKSHFNSRGAVKSSVSQLPIGKPDIDKLERAVLDSLTGIAYHDDSQVVKVSQEKIYTSALGDQPGARIRISYDPKADKPEEWHQQSIPLPGQEGVEDF